jgi:Tfp pilus assembly protein PilN
MRAVNLIPAEQRGGGAVGSRSSGAAFAVLGLLAGAAILTVLYGMASHQLSSRRAEAAALTARAQQVQAQAAQLASYTTFMELREQRLQTISQLIGSRFDWAGAMGELSRVLPSDVSLSALQGTIGSATGGATSSKSSSSSSSSSSAASTASGASGAAAATSVSSATPPGATPTFTLAGCAASQTVVAQMLVRLRLVSGVNNVTLQSSTKSSSGGGAGGGGACPASDPVFSVVVTFQPLPTPPATSTEALESTVFATGSGGSHKHVVSSASAGASR